MADEFASDSEDIDHDNYKGMYFEDEPGNKWQWPETGAHFDFKDMCKILEKISYERRSEERKSKNLIERIDIRRGGSLENKPAKVSIKKQLNLSLKQPINNPPEILIKNENNITENIRK